MINKIQTQHFVLHYLHKCVSQKVMGSEMHYDSIIYIKVRVFNPAFIIKIYMQSLETCGKCSQHASKPFLSIPLGVRHCTFPRLLHGFTPSPFSFLFRPPPTTTFKIRILIIWTSFWIWLSIVWFSDKPMVS